MALGSAPVAISVVSTEGSPVVSQVPPVVRWVRKQDLGESEATWRSGAQLRCVEAMEGAAMCVGGEEFEQ